MRSSGTKKQVRGGMNHAAAVRRQPLQVRVRQSQFRPTKVSFQNDRTHKQSLKACFKPSHHGFNTHKP